MVYLFCNRRFGQAFLEVACEFSHRHDFPVVIVHSVRSRAPAGGVVRWLKAGGQRKLREIQLGLRYGVRTRLVADVNSPIFRSTVASGARGVVAGFNQIFGADTIARFDSLVNFHPSVLPLYRGPVPSYWCIRHQEGQTGYTLHEVTERIDAGPILYQDVVDIGDTDDPEQLDEQIAFRACGTFERYLEHLRTGVPWRVARLDANAVYDMRVEYASFPDR